MNGIRPDAAGYDIFVDGIERTHRDLKETAYDAARALKSRNPALKVTIRDRATGESVSMRETAGPTEVKTSRRSPADKPAPACS